MNNKRRDKINSCIRQLEDLQNRVSKIDQSLESLKNLKITLDLWSKQVERIGQQMEDIFTEESNAYYSIPDNLQFGATADMIDWAMSNICEANKAIDSLKDKIDEVEDSYLMKFLPQFGPAPLQDTLSALIESIEEAISMSNGAKC